MPDGLISAYLLICEKVLHERDGIVSAIRLADFFNFQAAPEVPRQAIVIEMYFLANVKFVTDDRREHSIQIKVQRPDGQMRDAGASAVMPVLPKVEGAPKATNLIAQVGVAAVQTGLHFAILEVDGEECFRAPFSIQAQIVAETNNP